MGLEFFTESYLSWHLIKGIRTWRESERERGGKKKPTGEPPGSIPSSYEKHTSSKELNFHMLKVCG